MNSSTGNGTAGRRGTVWRTPDITADGLKTFACLMMLMQTIGITIIEKGMIHLDQYTQEALSRALDEDSHLMFLAGVGSILQLAGGLAIPVFAFLLVEGFLHTSDYRRYLITMAVTALVSEIPYDLAMSQKLMDWSGQNALVTMCICLVMLHFLQMFRDRKGLLALAAKILLVVSSIVWVTLLRAQYGLCIVLLVTVFYLLYEKQTLKTALGILVSLLYVTGPLSFYGIWSYCGERRERMPKYAYYLFYPLHLLVLGAAAKFMC